MTSPEVSYIVLSYNYENHIGEAIRSILAQTHQDFEIIVVDDASIDRSCEIVQAFGDPRIRLLRNSVNIGGAASYNRAVGAARGEWLSNLDADDWIASEKTRVQLDAAQGRPNLAVVGSFVRFVTDRGTPLPNPKAHEAEVNVARDLNDLSHWIGRNCLCRSSTLVRRSAHMKVGYDDVTMTRAPDYELWTRFLLKGHQISLVPQRLTYYRLHAQGVTYGDPFGTFTEICWILLRNLKPRAEAVGALQSVDDMSRWVVTNSRRFNLSEPALERVLGLFFEELRLENYAHFREVMERSDPAREALGRRRLQSIIQEETRSPKSLRSIARRGRKIISRAIEALRAQSSF